MHSVDDVQPMDLPHEPSSALCMGHWKIRVTSDSSGTLDGVESSLRALRYSFWVDANAPIEQPTVSIPYKEVT